MTITPINTPAPFQTLGFGCSAEPDRAVQGLQETFKAALGINNESLASMRRHADGLLRQQDRLDRLDTLGWLPHDSTPNVLLIECAGATDETLSELVAAHYTANWPEISSNILNLLESIGADTETLAVFEQVLAAHGHKLYRLTARALFPEIERVVRKELHGDAIKQITSQRDLKEHLLKLGLPDFQPGGLATYVVVRKFLRHVYDYASSPEILDRMATDATPNRHAALHGYLPYADQRASFNAIVVAEFALQAIFAHKRITSGET